MKRALSLTAFALVSAAFASPASAQFGGLADQIQGQAKSQVSNQKKYSTAPRRSNMSAPKARPNYGGTDGTGRFDMSGRSVSGYFSVRDRTTSFSTRYDTDPGRRSRSTYRPPTSAVTRRP
ncbi:hypothetical protein [Paludisphaera soli]|uniref:hypothetical protein n=1 Tax=Paludisphaera soli TaxID=2712865 RepID=UPI0013EA1C4B|nr:hypothetical protein [Paludisphaera soli]